jgi:hypothetical protein
MASTTKAQVYRVVHIPTTATATATEESHDIPDKDMPCGKSCIHCTHLAKVPLFTVGAGTHVARTDADVLMEYLASCYREFGAYMDKCAELENAEEAEEAKKAGPGPFCGKITSFVEELALQLSPQETSSSFRELFKKHFPALASLSIPEFLYEIWTLSKAKDGVDFFFRLGSEYRSPKDGAVFTFSKYRMFAKTGSIDQFIRIVFDLLTALHSSARFKEDVEVALECAEETYFVALPYNPDIRRSIEFRAQIVEAASGVKILNIEQYSEDYYLPGHVLNACVDAVIKFLRTTSIYSHLKPEDYSFDVAVCIDEDMSIKYVTAVEANPIREAGHPVIGHYLGKDADSTGISEVQECISEIVGKLTPGCLLDGVPGAWDVHGIIVVAITYSKYKMQLPASLSYDEVAANAVKKDFFASLSFDAIADDRMEDFKFGEPSSAEELQCLGDLMHLETNVRDEGSVSSFFYKLPQDVLTSTTSA